MNTMKKFDLEKYVILTIFSLGLGVVFVSFLTLASWIDSWNF